MHLFFVFLLAAFASPPPEFAVVNDLDSSILVESRYFSPHNFIGRPIKGYATGKCRLTKPAAMALLRVQRKLRRKGYTLKTYDCYRPQRAVDDFVAWAKDGDEKMKAEFYPRIPKNKIFEKGYVASKSGHSRGSTVDLTLVHVPVRAQQKYREGEALKDCAATPGERFADNMVDMGTGYDCFDPRSATASPAIGVKARENRLLLKTTMEEEGFKNYEEEWWHYTLRDEPFPETYFDFEN